MAIRKQNDTDLVMYRGDSGNLTVKFDSDVEAGTLIYLRVYNSKFKPIIDEISARVDEAGEVHFYISPEISSNFKVKKSEEYHTYYYGLKQVDELTGHENTIFLGCNPYYGDKYKLKVYHMKVEGLENGN